MRMQILSPATELAAISARSILNGTPVDQTSAAVSPEAGTRMALQVWRKWWPLFVEKAGVHQCRHEIFASHGFEKFDPRIPLDPAKERFCTIIFDNLEGLKEWIGCRLNVRTRKGKAIAERLLRDWRNARRRASRLRKLTQLDEIELKFVRATRRLAETEPAVWRLPPTTASAAMIGFVGLAHHLDVAAKWAQPRLLEGGASWQIETLKRLATSLPVEISGPIGAMVASLEKEPMAPVLAALYAAASWSPSKKGGGK